MKTSPYVRVVPSEAHRGADGTSRESIPSGPPPGARPIQRAAPTRWLTLAVAGALTLGALALAPSATAQYSVGNRVWADDGAGGGTANNGVQDGSEPGIPGVVVNVYAADGSGEPTGSALGTETTDSDGYYRFDALPAGTYVVVVDVVASGAALDGLMSSTGVSADFGISGDLRDHGQDQPLGAGSVVPGGIASRSVTVGPDLQPLLEQTSGVGQGANGPGGDESDNLVVDFGFVCASYVDGYVFLDFHGDGQFGALDVPLPDITVWVTNSQDVAISTVTDVTGYFRVYVPPGTTHVWVDTADPDFPAGHDRLADNNYGQGENPSTVTVDPCDSARDNTGFRRTSPSAATLLSLAAQADAGVVKVRWVTLNELGTVAFDLHRQLPDGEWLTVNSAPVFAMNSPIGADYEVVDTGVRARETHSYRLLEFMDSGATRSHGPIAVRITGEPGVPVVVSAVSVEDGQLRLTWAGDAGAYVVERSERLGAEAQWEPVPLATPEATSASLPLEGASGFFRVFRLP